jgi:eukaryotic-like serine/threonine-protein kinase
MASDARDEPGEDADRTTQHASIATASHPALIGPYRVLALIGEGAMGIVYEAEQERPRRRVALKIIRPGVSTPAMLRRFEHEYEFLGRLQHDGIAQIYQAGIADTGFGPQPYFAMELVRGRKLDDYARLKELDLRQRLTMVAEIADAVQHAHHRGVIHRDLKPANILVTESGHPKVLDFGLARAAQAELQSTVQTMAGEVVGTMSYMSPEQVVGDMSELDTRSDVYALGVVLYELLSGRLPFDLSRKSLPEAVRIIRDEEPTRLSSITRALPGDVETIVAKALEKDKLRRYGSAADLAGDIRRFLRNEPIVARRPSASYQVRKFAHRHRGLVGGAVAVLVALVAGVVVSTWQAVRASRAERVAQARATEAQGEKAKAEAVTTFLTDMLASANPSQARGRDVTVRMALDEAARKIDAGAMKGEPDIEVAVRNAIATTYEGLGLFEPAERQLRTSLDLQSRALRNPLLRADTDSRLVNVLYKHQKFAEARPVAEEAVRLRQEALGPRHADTATSLDDLGAILMANGDAVAAEARMREALAIRRDVLGPDDPQLSTSLNNVGFALQEKGDVQQAQAMFLESLAIDKRRLGNDHPEVAIKLVNLARLNNDLHRPEAAEPFAREAVAIRRKVLGNDHPALANALDQLASAVEVRQPDEEEPLRREALAILTRALGAGHRETARLQSNLGFMLYRRGAYPEAVSLYRAALASLRQTLGAESSLALGAQAGLAQNLNGLGDFRGAEEAAREALAVYRKQPTNQQVVTVLMALGDALVGQRRLTEAIPYLRQANAIFDKGGPRRTPWYKPEAQSSLGAALASTDDRAEAERLLLAGYQGLQAVASTPPVRLRASIERLIAFYAASGRRDDAAEWRKRLPAVGATGQRVEASAVR